MISFEFYEIFMNTIFHRTQSHAHKYLESIHLHQDLGGGQNLNIQYQVKYLRWDILRKYLTAESY